MQKRHTNRERYFEEQAQTSRNYYIPYIKKIIGYIPNTVLEVGCGEGSTLSLHEYSKQAHSSRRNVKKAIS